MTTTEKRTMVDAVRQVCDGVRPGVRGPGCAAIIMADGRRYHVVSIHDTLVERYDGRGELVERLEAAEVSGDVECVSWTCDELGGIYC